MGETGYKYIRATFSNALKSLSKADIEIRNVKTEQLYSVEDVALSTDGYTADITIAGNTADAGTTFLMPSTIYSCKMSSDGLDATLEFQLPDVWSDMLVTSVDVEKNTITVYGSVRKGGHFEDYAQTFNVGDNYDGNIGELVGHTVVVGLDADNNITSLKVNDGAVAFGYVTAKDGDNDNKFTSSKDYFETASGDKYYLSTTYTSSTNYSMYVWANNKGGFGFMTDGDIDPKDTFEYGKLVLNPNGTVSAAVLWTAFDGHIIATEADGSVAKETSNNSKDFKGYTVIDGFTFEYRDPKSLEDGDIIYYDSDDKLAFIYNENVEGDLETVYQDKLVIDGDKYNFIVWTDGHEHVAGWEAKQARYYDAANDTYEKVTEKWANTIDKDEPVTVYLDTKGDIVFVDATVGEAVTHSKEYIITKSPKAYKSGLDEMMDMSVSDGTEVTLHIKASDITSINGDTFGDVTFSDTTGKYVFNIVDHDGKKTNAAKKANGDSSGSDAAVPSTMFQQGTLIDVIYNDDETKVTGLNVKLGNVTGVKVGTRETAIPDINMKVDKDVEFKAGLSSIKTDTGSLNLTGNTKVYVLTGTRTGAKFLGQTNDSFQNDIEDDTAYNQMKESTDNKVKLYNYSDFDNNTQAGDAQLYKIATEKDAATGTAEANEVTASGPSVGKLVRFVADGTTAKVVVIDNRGINLNVNTTNTPVLGRVGAQNDINGNQVFKSAETTTKILGVATKAEYQLNSDNATEQLAGLSILTVDGSVELDSFADKIDTEQDVKDQIVVAELDATGKVTKVNEGGYQVGTPDVDKVNWGRKVGSTSTDTLTVTTTVGNVKVKADTNCLVVKFNGSSYSESSIGDINRDTNYTGVMFYTSQLNGSDVKATVIVATKDYPTGSYNQVATLLLAAEDELTVGETTTVSLFDQFGELMLFPAAATSSAPASVDFVGTNNTTVNTVTIKAKAVGTATITVGTLSETITVVAGTVAALTPVASAAAVTTADTGNTVAANSAGTITWNTMATQGAATVKVQESSDSTDGVDGTWVDTVAVITWTQTGNSSATTASIAGGASPTTAISAALTMTRGKYYRLVATATDPTAFDDVVTTGDKFDYLTPTAPTTVSSLTATQVTLDHDSVGMITVKDSTGNPVGYSKCTAAAATGVAHTLTTNSDGTTVAATNLVSGIYTVDFDYDNTI